MRHGDKAWLVDGKGKGIKRHKDWRSKVADAALAAVPDGFVLYDCPVAVNLRFLQTKPKSKPAWKHWADTTHDVDKLARSVLDSLTKTVIINDSRVVRLSATKQYSDTPGVHVTVYCLPPEKP